MTDPAPTAADRRLDEHLELLRSDVPDGGVSLSRRIARTARWQRVVRAPLRAAGSILGAVADGLGALTGSRRRRS